MRHFDKGKLVGEQDTPIDFGNWLRDEIAHARRISEKTDSRSSLTDWLSPHTRLTALLEAQAAFNDSRRSS